MRRKLPARIRFAQLVLTLGLLVGLAPATHAADADPKVPFERYTLDNGLEIILHQDRRVPIVAVNVWYHVGSGDETPGKSGFAHLFEHMMFQGAKHIGEDVHFDLLKKIGGTGINGSTTSDRTNYFETVPSNQIETALWLESDRMGYMLSLLNEKSLANQRDVVRNERRQRYDNVPYGKERFALSAALYGEGHPYRYMTIGLHEDLERASLGDVTSFFKKWYVPANATLVIAGDFETDQAKKLVAKWFGTFPKTTRPAHTEIAPTAVAGPARQSIQDDFAKLRRVHYAWHSPKQYAPGDAELEILADVLGREGTGRLYKVLVHERQLAQNVAVYQYGAGFSGTFNVIVDLKADADQAEVEKILDKELERAMREPLSDREIKRAVVGVESSFVWGLEDLMARVETLQGYNHFVGRPDYISQDLARYRTATPQDILAMAARTLGKRGRVEVITTPSSKGGN